MSETIPLSVPSIKGNEWTYVKECLDTEWVSSAGKFVDRFEAGMSEFAGAPYSIACVNGTAALHAALLVAGVQPGEEVIVPTITFIAPVNAVRYVGAFPVFMDCDDCYNLDVQKTVEFIEKETTVEKGFAYNRATKRKIGAVVPVHVFGSAVNLEPLVEVCESRGIRIVEDATESLGTRYSSGRLLGMHAGTVGDLGCFSFNGNKIITTGGGGMIVTRDKGFADKARYLTTQAKNDDLLYIHDEVGYNYRLTNVQAALGVAQLERLSEYVEIKRRNYSIYKKEIDRIPGLHLAEGPAYASNNHWMYALQIHKSVFPMDRDGLLKHLRKDRIESRPVWYLNHLQKPYRECQSYKIEKAYKMLDITLNIPCSVNLTENDIGFVIDKLKNA
jgi:perosamine synthetase